MTNNKNMMDIIYDRMCCIDEQTTIIEDKSKEIIEMTGRINLILDHVLKERKRRLN